MREICHANYNQKKAGMAIFIPNILNFISKKSIMTVNKKNLVIIKGSIHRK